MIRTTLLILSVCFFTLIYGQNLAVLPSNPPLTEKDWLVTPLKEKAAVYRSADGRDIILYNGLTKRTFRLQPNLSCTDYSNMRTGRQLLRAVREEARITINDVEYRVGGLYGQKEKAYLLPEWVDGFTAGANDFRYVSFETGMVNHDIKPSGKFWRSEQKPVSGITVSFLFRSRLPSLKGLDINVVYELYDGIPLIVKYLKIENHGTSSYHIGRVVNEVLAMVEEESAVVGKPEQMKKPQGIYFETNYAFNNAMRYSISDQTTHWKTDSSYTSQVNYYYETPCVLEVYPDYGPGIDLNPGKDFQSVKTYELLMDNDDRERRGLAVRKMYRAIAPWTSANPIFMHLVSKNDDEVKQAVDQCAATGYEALILSFGSHINMEDISMDNIRRWKSLADYAHRKGVFIGGYSLFSSRKISEEDDVINPLTGKTGGAFFGNAPCFGSNWGLAYRDKIRYFFAETGFDIWENDGPYPGDRCASEKHPGHKGLHDSQWKQMEIQKELYRWLNAKGVYINAPDWYFLDGTHKTGIGYREVNFSLPREQQMILNRQNIYDGTWEKTPSMGWGFVPLTRYQGGGEEAVLEPLSRHLKDYKQLMMQYYGSGVQACYRGPRLYDTDETKQTVTSVIQWYKKYRDILNADIIHLRRADGRDWDGILHVNPVLKQKGLLMIYNPLKQSITRKIKLPLYYTGLTGKASIKKEEGPPVAYTLNSDDEAELTITLQPDSYTWYVIE